jgi:hypothetical protein
MEYWNIGLNNLGRNFALTPLFHHSNIPIFQTLVGVAPSRKYTKKVLESQIILILFYYNFVISKNLKIRNK